MAPAVPKSLVRWSAVLLWGGLIFYLSSRPPESVPLPSLFWGEDKILHALEYALLSFLLARALGFGGRRAAMVAIVLASLYGLSDEFHQSFVSGRDPSGWDWLADVAGAALVHWRRLWAGPRLMGGAGQ